MMQKDGMVEGTPRGDRFRETDRQRRVECARMLISVITDICRYDVLLGGSANIRLTIAFGAGNNINISIVAHAKGGPRSRVFKRKNPKSGPLC